MGKIYFRYLENKEKTDLLPKLFRILYTNMSQIATWEGTYKDDESAWLSYIIPELTSGRTKILLMYAGEEIAGYFQYRIQGDTLYADEVEIKQEYQRTFLFYRFCRHLRQWMPEEIRYVSSYVNVENHNSIAIHERLGMERIGTNKRGTSWLYRGERKKMEGRLR